MPHFNRKQHWETIYQNKQPNEVSWYQPTPETSLQLIAQSNLPLTANIIDVGGGDSFLIDHLLEQGYQNLTVLDISKAAIERAQQRLGQQAATVTWLEADAANFTPTQTYHLWHDRAAFHFLTDSQEISNYLQTAHAHLHANGTLIIGSFSTNGPTKCSGIEITQYSEQSMAESLSPWFEPLDCTTVNHTTPFNTVQNFVFCRFRPKPTAG